MCKALWSCCSWASWAISRSSSASFSRCVQVLAEFLSELRRRSAPWAEAWSFHRFGCAASVSSAAICLFVSWMSKRPRCLLDICPERSCLLECLVHVGYLHVVLTSVSPALPEDWVSYGFGVGRLGRGPASGMVMTGYPFSWANLTMCLVPFPPGNAITRSGLDVRSISLFLWKPAPLSM